MTPPREPRTAAGARRALLGQTNDTVAQWQAEAAGAPLRRRVEQEPLEIEVPDYERATPVPAPLDELAAAIEQGFRAGRMYQQRHPDSDPMAARVAAAEDTDAQ